MRGVLAVSVLVTCLGGILGKPLDSKDRPMERVEFHGEVVYVPKPVKVDPFSNTVPADERMPDMILNEDQKEFLREQEEDKKDGRSKRKARRETVLRWPKSGNEVNVPYVFDSSSEGDRSYIMAAMNHWEELTCVRFQELTSNPGNTQYLRFFKENGCWSYVGMQSIQERLPQDISIGSGCTELGTIAHEIGHAMGFEHEQSRPDRDDYVEIFLDNVQSGMEHNFDKETLANVMADDVVEYDVKSVMHYGAYGFAIDSNIPTLVTKRAFDMQYIGQREGLSFYDVKLANFIYNCDDGCPSLECANGGFVDKSCTCQCPPGWTGTLCDEEGTEEAVCEFTLTGSSGEIKSPGYDSGQYSINSECMYLINGGPGCTVTLTFETFDLEAYDTSNSRCWDYVQVNTDDLRYGGNKYCGSGTISPIVANDNMMIWFYSDETVTANGFKAQYTIDNCPVATTEAPVVTTKAPVVTTEAPVVTTEAPVITTEVPVVTTQAPVITTEVPVVTTQAPVASTQAPVATTQAPVVTTKAPVVTTEAPVVTTEAPVITTEVPVVTTQAPVASTQAPVETTQAPVETTQTPVETTQAPVETTQAPVETTQAPIETTEVAVAAVTTEVPLKILVSPNYPNCYNAKKRIKYVLTADPGERVYLMINDMQIEEGPRGSSCPYDVLIIDLEGSGSSEFTTSLCGEMTNLGPFISESNKMVLTFITDEAVEMRGFSVSYKPITEVTCGGTFTADSGTLQSLNYPIQYSNDLSCDYVIQVEPGKTIELTFDDLDIESSRRYRCQYDCLELFQNNQFGQTESILRLDGNRLPWFPIYSRSNELTLHFSTDQYVGGRGFRVSYRAL